MTPEPSDPLLAALSDLTGPRPPAARDSRIRARCHAALSARTTARPRGRRFSARALDTLLAVAVVVYGVVTLVEGLTVAGIL